MLALHGAFGDALTHHKEALRLRKLARETAGGVSSAMLTYSEHCHALLVLEHRVNGAQAALRSHEQCWNSQDGGPYPGSYNTAQYMHALGVAYDDAGMVADAIDAFACVAGAGPAAPEPGDDRNFESRYTTRWQHLFPRESEALKDARVRLVARLSEQQADMHALMAGDLAVWTRPQRRAEYEHLIGIAPIGFHSDWTCGRLPDADFTNANAVHQTKRASSSAPIRVSSSGEAVAEGGPTFLRNWCYTGSAVWYGGTSVSSTPALMDYLIEVDRQHLGAVRGCQADRMHRRLRFCLFPDGRVGDAGLCGAGVAP